MLIHPYQPPGTEKNLARTPSPGGRENSRTRTIALVAHIFAILAYFTAKAIQWNAFAEMGPGFWIAADVSVAATIAMLATWIILAIIMLTNAAVWRFRLTYVALACLVITGIYIERLLLNALRFVYP
jgi:hypothetical protein